MKQIRQIAILTALLSASMMYADLQVTGNGQVKVGEIDAVVGTSSANDTNGIAAASGVGTGTGPGIVTHPDTTAQLFVSGSSVYRSGGVISFGNRNDVSVSETAYDAVSSKKGQLMLKGNGGIRFTSEDSMIFSYDTNSSDCR